MDVEKPETAIPVSTVYIANERACPSHQLRNRNRSQDSPASSCVQLAKDFVTIRRRIGDIDIGCEQVSHSTPKGGQNYDCDVDGSGLEGRTPEDSGYLSRGKSFVSSFLSDSLVFPFQKERSRLFDVNESNSNSRPARRLHNWLPFVLLFVVLASAIVAVCTLNNALRSGERTANGKYRSIEYGHVQRMKREVDVEAPKVEKILKVNGDLLGGKGSAVQPAYDPNSNEVAAEGENVAFDQDPGSEVPGEDVLWDDDVEIFDSLEFIQELQDYAASKLEEKKEKRKQELLKKIGSFGHFSTSVVKLNEKAEGNKRKPKKRSPKSPNDRSDPFRFFKSQMSKPSKDLPNAPKDYDDPSGFR